MIVVLQIIVLIVSILWVTIGCVIFKEGYELALTGASRSCMTPSFYQLLEKMPLIVGVLFFFTLGMLWGKVVFKIGFMAGRRERRHRG